MKKEINAYLNSILTIQLPIKSNKNSEKYFKQKQQLIFENCTTDFDFNMNLKLKYNSIYFRTFEILNEFIEDPFLISVPKAFLIDCIKHLRIKYDSSYSIDYKSIAELLYNYNYQYADEFKNNLQQFHKFNGYLTIITTELNNNLSNLQDKLDNIFDPILSIQIIEFLKNNYNTLTGVTTSFDRDLTKPIITQKQAVIILNRNALKYSQDWKDTLEHEITHFIQRIVSLDKTLIKSYNYLPVSMYKYANLRDNLVQISNLPIKTINIGLFKYISYIYQKHEFQTTIKTLLNKIQRQYQTSKIQFLLNNKWKLNINKLQNRNIWLNNFLIKLNKFDKTFGQLFDTYLLKSRSQLKTYNELLKYEFVYIFLTYQILKVNNINNIDEIIKQHFQKFKLRDI